MSVIYSFLQKRKLHESHYGFIMVFIAYVLSALMLVLGSDLFYNINTAAAGFNTVIDEETQNYFKANTELVNPYGLPSTTSKDLVYSMPSKSTPESDTIWFLGKAMDEATFDSLMVQAGSDIYPITDKFTAGKAADKEASTTSLSKMETSSETGTNISIKEMQMLEHIVQAEAGGEDMVGKILIVNVIMNRVADKHFPDTIKEVIFQKSDGDYQFSPVGSGRYWSVKISDETEEAVKRAIEGEDYSKGALYFVARDKTDSKKIKWFDNRLDWLFVHGGHEFYKNK